MNISDPKIKAVKGILLLRKVIAHLLHADLKYFGFGKDRNNKGRPKGILTPLGAFISAPSEFCPFTST
jgi:hypothetical protein